MTLQIKKPHLQLAALFVVALPVFGWAQWNPQVWLDRQLAAQGMQSSLQYASVSKAFPGLHLEGVNISSPVIIHLALDELMLRPVFSDILSSSPGLFAKAHTEGVRAESIISRIDNKLEFRDIRLHADAASLHRFDSRLLLLGLSGMLELKGYTLIQADSGLPLDGAVDINWSKPSSNLLPPGMEQIKLRLNATDAEGLNVWSWKIESTPDVVTGEGRIVTNGADSRQWLLHGKLRSAKDAADIMLSGTLGAPHWQ